MKYTTLTNCDDVNFHHDFNGSIDEIKEKFEQWCAKQKPVWAHLFQSNDGKLVATYYSHLGMTFFIPSKSFVNQI